MRFDIRSYVLVSALFFMLRMFARDFLTLFLTLLFGMRHFLTRGCFFRVVMTAAFTLRTMVTITRFFVGSFLMLSLFAL